MAYASLTNEEFRAFHSAARAALTAGSKIIRWKVGDSEVEKQATIDWTNPASWAAIDAEFCLRFPESVRPRRTRTQVSFA